MITLIIILFVLVTGLSIYSISKNNKKIKELNSLDELAPEKIEPIYFVQEEVVVEEKKKPAKKTAKKKAEPKTKPVKKSVKKATKK